MPKKDKVRLISGISDNKPTAVDYHERIGRMNVARLRQYIRKLEDEGMTTQHREECYAYAKACLPAAIKKEKEAEEEKEAEKARIAKDIEKKQEQQRQKNLATAERKADFSKVGNDRIRSIIYDEYVQMNRERQPKLPEEKRILKLENVRKALCNIDFVNGMVNSEKYGRFPADIIYLKDKNVLVFSGFLQECYIYMPCQENTKLCVVSSETKRTPGFDTKQGVLKSDLCVVRKAFWEPTFCRFTAGFLCQFLSKYYLNYEERASEGAETTNIPKCVMRK